MRKVEVAHLLYQRQIHRRYSRDLVKLLGRYALPSASRFEHHSPFRRQIRMQRCQRISNTTVFRFPGVLTTLADMGFAIRPLRPFQQRHTTRRTYHLTQLAASTKSRRTKLNTLLHGTTCILSSQAINSTLPIHLSNPARIFPHLRITTHQRTRLERSGKNFLRGYSWQRHPSALTLDLQSPLDPVKARVGGGKPRKAKYNVELQVKHQEGHTSTPLPA